VVGLPRSQPLLFDNLLLFDVSLLGAHPTTLAPRLAQAGKDVPGGTPHPLLPLGFPFGAPPAGSTFGSSSGMGIGLDLLAVLALLLVLSRTGRSSVSPREGFKLVSSPRLVTELPG
jgi:hypothetical protein